MENRGRFYCKPCNCWMDDNRASKGLHFSGLKHKAAVERQRKAAKEERESEKRTEASIDQKLHDIRRAAERAMSTSHEATSLSALKPVQKEYLPESKPSNVPKDRSTIFFSGMECQCLTDEGTWCSAVISVCREGYLEPVFDVTLFKEHGEMEVLEEVPLCKLRANAPKDIEEVQESGHAVLPHSQCPPAPVAEVDSNTGLGTWQTVSTTIIDSTSSPERSADTHHSKKPKPEAARVQYKGVNLEGPSSSAVNDDMASVAHGVQISFKKRMRKKRPIQECLDSGEGV